MKTTENSADNYQIDVLSLNGIDIRNEYLALAIFESIFDNFTSLSIDIMEETGILETSDFQDGDTTLEISYYTKYPPFTPEMGSYTNTFQLYDTERVKSAGQGKRFYRMHFTSKDFHTNNTKLISRPYRDKSSTEIIESLFGFLGASLPLAVEGSEDIIPLFVVPNLQPVNCINLLCREAFKADMNDYVFFQSKDEYVCKPITKLMEEGPIIEYIMDQTSLSWEDDKKKEHRNIIEYSNDDYNWNNLANMNTGMYGSRMLTRNVLSKLHDFVTYEGKPTPISGENNKHVYVSDNYHNREVVREYAQDRSYRVKRINDTRLLLTVPGNTDLTVGKTIDVKVPTNREMSITDPSVTREDDAHLSGKYLIGKMKHEISATETKFIIECIKVDS